MAYSKHLCGVATDLSLRCLARFRDSGGVVSGMVIALCCHQLCSYDSYFNPTYLSDLGISRDDFNMIAMISTWAVCGEPVRGSDEEHWTGMSYLEREELGYMCKRVLDYGRVKQLEALGASCELVYYVDRSTSKENMALLCTWD